ncbi:MBOAT family protein [Nocardioides sp. zg-536]|uniref:MBOAT family protein n=1 Tax=Nocardioides faecalis TaxID=2803858 RepID=A0A939BW03_9ACTN|nr:MBOAT family protein [Nocardioides faecalis]MBM9460077.1 MBOAT family protein [Nocardioides faecalis]QVI60125.1 MBOAT family protein [Nocardioides faecalis]
MSFAAPLFLWYFLPAVLLAHWILPVRFRNAIIAVFSIAFYAVGGKEFVLLLLTMMVVNYAAGLAIGRARAADRTRGLTSPKGILVATVAGDLAVLAIWKYLGFASVAIDQLGRALGGSGSPVIELALPIGISFFTFHHLSYVVDVYRGTRTPMRNPLTFATYIAMFPQLIAGPIVRYHEIADQLRNQHHDRWGDFVEGFPRFAWGLFKKVVIADSLATVADTAFATSDPTFTTAWVGALAYTGQIYFDFSGYSDMAIGLGMMFGLRLPENFRRPYSADSVTDFWRRWHMSLSRWFRDYLYIPLGGNRGGRTATYRNLSIVFLATGLWHGAAWTFVLWGAYHGALLIFERATGLAKVEGYVVVRRAVTFVLVVFGWVLFRAADLDEFTKMAGAMLVPDGLTLPALGLAPELLTSTAPHEWVLLAVVPMLVLLPGTFVMGRVIDGLDGTSPRRQLTARLVALCSSPYAALAAVAGGFSPFLYFQF